MKNKFAFGISLFFNFFLLILIFGVFYYTTDNSEISDSIKKDIKIECISELREEQGLPPLLEELYMTKGDILSVNENSIVIVPEKNIGNNPLGLVLESEIEVSINSDTTIREKHWEQSENFKEEMSIYLKSLSEGVIGQDMPGNYIYTDIEISGLGIGDFISIKTEDNLINRKKIQAKEIILIQGMSEALGEV